LNYDYRTKVTNKILESAKDLTIEQTINKYKHLNLLKSELNMYFTRFHIHRKFVNGCKCNSCLSIIRKLEKYKLSIEEYEYITKECFICGWRYNINIHHIIYRRYKGEDINRIVKEYHNRIIFKFLCNH